MPPIYKCTEIEKLARKLGWSLKRTKGSHHIYSILKDGVSKIVSIPIHNGDMPKGTLDNILDSMGITHKELRSVLGKKN